MDTNNGTMMENDARRAEARRSDSAGARDFMKVVTGVAQMTGLNSATVERRMNTLEPGGLLMYAAAVALHNDLKGVVHELETFSRVVARAAEMIADTNRSE